MAPENQRNKSLAARAAWPLLVLTAALQAFLGLSIVAYVFMGVPNPAAMHGEWLAAATSALQVLAAIWAFVLAVRRDLRGTILAVSASIMLGWLATVPAALVQGLDFHSDDKLTPVIFILSPLLAIASAALAWRDVYLVAAALIASLMTFLGILIVVVFGILIALYGF